MDYKKALRFLKKRTAQNEHKYKNNKNLFGTIKKKANKIYYSNKWFLYKYWSETPNEIPKPSKTFEAYNSKVKVNMDSKPLLINELKDAFFSLKRSSVVDDVSILSKSALG